MWFGGEAKWYSLSDLVDTPPTGGVNVIEANADGGYLAGTTEDDLFRGKDGNDIFYGDKGDDEYQGGGGYNQVDYDGSAGDYQFILNRTARPRSPIRNTERYTQGYRRDLVFAARANGIR